MRLFERDVENRGLAWFVADVVFRSTFGRHVAQIDLLVQDLNLKWATRTTGK